MKKIVSLLLILTLVAALVPAAFAAASTNYTISSVNAGTATPEVLVGNKLTLSVGISHTTSDPAPDEIMVTLVTDASSSVYPFEIDQINYTHALKKGEGDKYVYDAVLPTRPGAASGYYNLTFRIDAVKKAGETDFSYLPDPETLTLTVKVNAPQAPAPTPTPATPKVIISFFSTSSNPVSAGERFSLYVTFKNTGSVAVNNLKAQFSSDGTFTTVSGSTTVFIDSIPAGGTTSRSVYLSIKADTVPGSYSANFSLNYDVPGIAEPVTGTETISIPVSQPLKVQFTEMSVNPSIVYVGQDVNVMSSINNTGKASIYNVNVSFAGSIGFTGINKYIGNLQPGATGNIDLYLTPEKEGTGKIVMTVTFEDEQGAKNTKVLEKDTEILPKATPDDPSPIVPVDPSGSGFPWWIIIVVVLLGGLAAVIVIKKRKEKLHKLNDLAEAQLLDEQLVEENEDAVKPSLDGSDIDAGDGLPGDKQ